MILDERNEFCDVSSVALSAGNRIRGDVIDLGSSPTLQDIGSGQPVYLVIQASNVFAGAGNVRFDLLSDSTADLATSPTTHVTTGDEAYTAWPVGRRKVFALPHEQTYERYLGIWYTNSGTMTGGTINAFLTTEPAKYTSYDDGI